VAQLEDQGLDGRFCLTGLLHSLLTVIAKPVVWAEAISFCRIGGRCSRAAPSR
jgi:hypothetical protein